MNAPLPGCPAIAAGASVEDPTARVAAEILAAEGLDADSPEQTDALLWSHDIDPAQVAAYRADVLAIAARVRASARADRQRLFRSMLASLRNIDKNELVEAGVLTGTDADKSKQWCKLNCDPQVFYLRLDDRREAAFFALIEARQGSRARPRMATGVPFSDGRA